jgi:CMP-N-acetylneuraminic acid synthetase
LEIAKADYLLMKEVLGLIPARGGSKSIPHKNIAPLLGRPLLVYTCEAALASARLTRVVLSTDDEEIAEVGRRCGVEVPFVRPGELAGDEASSLSVAKHAVRWMAENQGFSPDVLMLLQPTSPLRRAAHIDGALLQMENTKVDTVVSVVEVPHRFSPFSIMELKQDLLSDFWQATLPFDRYRRQEVPRFYARNGPAILATRVSVVLDSDSFYGDRVGPYLMEPADSIDIDSAFDLELAACMLQRREGTSET